MMNHGFGFGFGIPGLGMFLSWGLIMLLLVLAVRAFTGGRSGGESPRQILDRRYAEGQIDREDYERRKRDLG